MHPAQWVVCDKKGNGTTMRWIDRTFGRRYVWFCALIGALVIGVSSFGSTASAAPAQPIAGVAGWCWCTDYAVAYTGLASPGLNAEFWGGYLVSKGYSLKTSPQAGDMVVYSATRMQNGAGHIGVIKSLVGTTGLIVRGANQTSSTTFTSLGCTNVSDVQFVRRTSGEAYYRR